MSHSIRLTLRPGLHLNLDIEEVPQVAGSGDIKPQPRDDGGVIFNLTIQARRIAGNAEGEADSPNTAATTPEEIRENNWSITGIGDQGYLISNNRFADLSHQPPPFSENHPELARFNAKHLGVEP